MGNENFTKITLRSARINVGLKGEEVALQINVSPQTLYSWENGETDIGWYNLERLCEIYGVDIKQLKNVYKEKG